MTSRPRLVPWSVAGAGRVRVEAMSVGEGRLAQFTDPQVAQCRGGVVPLQGEKEAARWVAYVAVADAAAAAVQGNGGAVLMPAADVPDAGRIAFLADPGQAVLGVLKPNPRQG
ncbi:hypothetical protein AB5J72_02120 [Streptomyces sp. CG1]|uniref:hypothetical protein n=1 Tax=Streptomyces sp. CG1 TaxID=1287523 RepID=UPI0034E301F2